MRTNLSEFGVSACRSLFIFIGLVGLLLSYPGIGHSGEKENPRPVISVYFPDYRLKAAGENPEFYGTTHLILFSAKPNEDGSVDFERITPGMIEMGKTARENSEAGMKVTFCVGGWGRGKLFANAVSTAENRERFVTALVSFCERYELDGVDIDWEFPRGEIEHANFSTFLKSLSAGLHEKGKILTVALGETRPLSPGDYAVIDQVNLMSYQPWNPQDYNEWLEKAVKRMLDSGVPPKKLNIGVGFFTKENGGERRAISWAKLAKQEQMSLPETVHEFSPVGKQACDLRIALMEKYQLGGVMIWDWGHDSPSPEKSLLKHLSQKLK